MENNLREVAKKEKEVWPVEFRQFAYSLPITSL